MRRKILILTILLFAVAIVVIYKITKPAANNDKTIKLGAIFCSTGVAGDYGKKSVDGVQMAIHLINQGGGINGKKIELILEDSKSSPKDALSAFRKLIDIDQTHLILGDVYSATTKVLIQNLPNDVLLFAPGASAPDLVNINKNFIRNWTSDNFDGLAMAKIVLQSNVHEIATLTQINDYAIALNSAFKKEFILGGGRTTIEEQFEGEQNDYRQVLNKLKSEKVKYVYLTALSKEMGTILKQADEIQFKPQWFTNLSVNKEECKKIAGPVLNGVIFSQPYINFDMLDAQTKAFIGLYKKEREVNPDETVAHAFDAMNILALAIKQVGTDPNKLVSYINKIKNFPGLSGKTTFDGRGGVMKDIEVLQFTGSTTKSIKIFTF